MRAWALAAALLALSPGEALAEVLAGPLQPLAFMIGDWRSVGEGTGPGSGGDSSIHSELLGRVVVRRDHVRLKAGGGFEIYMVMFAQGDGAAADFIDTEGHTIHYAMKPGPGPSAVFESPGAAGTPDFRLTYVASGNDRLHIRFEIAPPGGRYQIYSEGDVVRR